MPIALWGGTCRPASGSSQNKIFALCWPGAATVWGCAPCHCKSPVGEQSRKEGDSADGRRASAKSCFLPPHRGGNAILSLLPLVSCVNCALPWIALMSMFWRFLPGLPELGLEVASGPSQLYSCFLPLLMVHFTFSVRPVSALQVQLPSPILMCCIHQGKTQYFNAHCMTTVIFKYKAISCWLARSPRR